MKKTLLLSLLLFSIFCFSQESKEKEEKLAYKDTLKRQTITIDGLTGEPDKNLIYTPYNSWVTVKVKNVNPFKTALKTELSFTNFDLGKTDNLPGLLDIIQTPAKPADNPNATNTRENIESLQKSLELFQKSLLKNSNLLDDAESNKNKDNLSVKKKKEIADSIKILKDNIDLLEKLIEKMKLDEQNEKKFKEAYDNFVTSINEVSNFLALNYPVSQLFKEQFISKDYTVKMIKQLLKSRLPGYNSDDEIVSKANEFLKSSFSKLLQNHADAYLAYQKINTPPDTDTYKGSGTLKVNDNAELKIGNLELKIIREAKYKDQMAFMNSKVNIAKNDSIKQSAFVYSDTLTSRIERILTDSFEQTLKSFRANADEIKITVPLANVEPFTVATTGRFRVDVSTGLFAHIGHSDDKYKTIKDANNETYIIKQKAEGVNFAIGFLINAYKYEPRKDINLGASLGINFPVNGSTTNNTSSIQLVGGLSLFTTSVDRLSLTIGISLRKGQHLNTNNLNAANNESYTFKNINDIDPIYDPVYRVGGFFGVSYSLFGNKSKETK